MHTLPTRRKVPHWEVPGGTVCLTWRLRRDQTPLTAQERELVATVIQRSDGRDCGLVAGVIMDDHAHILVRVGVTTTGGRLAWQWKSIASHELCREGSRSAPLWQRNYFDRWMRDEEQTAACAEYVRNNPFRRWPQLTEYRWLLPRSGGGE